MGILNLTPDSFFEGSRAMDSDAVASRVRQLVAEGADIIDVGAYSTRPGAGDVSVDDELERLERGMAVLRAIDADIPVSVDTFRADIARQAVTNMRCDIVNDISGTNLDVAMADTVAALQCPYILTHMRGTPADMMEYTDYRDVTNDVLSELGDRLQWLRMAGVTDIIVDPGFGFSKTMAQNYELLHNLERLRLLHCPIMVGISRKSMITKLLDISADNALNGTTALNAFALDRGADLLRVHDVGPCRQTVSLHTALAHPRQLEQQ